MVDSEGRIFACIQNRLAMFLPGGETPEWEYRTGGLIPRSAAIGPDGNVRVHSSDRCLHVVDPEGRKVIEPAIVGDPLGWASPLVDQQNNTWIARAQGGLTKVPPDGKMDERPFVRTRRRFDCTGLICQGTLFIGCEDHYVYAFPLDGDRGSNMWADSPDCGRTHCAVTSPLALGSGSQLLVASQDNSLYGFTLEGKELWSIPLPGQLLGSPVVGKDGMIFAGISQNPRNQEGKGILLAIEPNSHRTLWQYQVDAPIESTPVIGDDGLLYFGDNAGVVHAIDVDGRPQWKAEFNAPVRSAGTIIGDGRLAFGLDDGCLVVLQCSSTRVCDEGWPKLLGSIGQSGSCPG